MVLAVMAMQLTVMCYVLRLNAVNADPSGAVAAAHEDRMPLKDVEESCHAA